MPSEIQTPSTTPSIDRLELGASSVRGTNPSMPPMPCTPPCMCAEVEVSTFCPPICVCSEVE